MRCLTAYMQCASKQSRLDKRKDKDKKRQKDKNADMQWHDAEVTSVWQVQGVTKFVANRNLPLALKEDISRHLEGSQVIHNEQVEGDVFSRLSHTLQVHLPGQSSHPHLYTMWAVACNRMMRRMG